MEMSRDSDSIAAAPVLQFISRSDADRHLLLPATTARRRTNIITGRDDDGVCTETNHSYYLRSCVYLFFCHAVDSVLLHICCCHCLKSRLSSPGDLLVPRNRPQKVFTFCMRQLSNLCSSSLVLLIARWVYLRPFDVKPMLGACTVNEFHLHWPPTASASAPAGHPHLSFNITTHLLFKNSHQYYGVGYDHPAAALFYAGEKLGPADDQIPAFRQDPLKSSVVDQLVVGRLRNASATVVQTFTADRAKGGFEMVMRIRVTLSYKFWPFKGDYFTLYDCPLSSPIPRTGQPAVSSPAYCHTVKL